MQCHGYDIEHRGWICLASLHRVRSFSDVISSYIHDCTIKLQVTDFVKYLSIFCNNVFSNKEHYMLNVFSNWFSNYFHNCCRFVVVCHKSFGFILQKPNLCEHFCMRGISYVDGVTHKMNRYN